MTGEAVTKSASAELVDVALDGVSAAADPLSVPAGFPVAPVVLVVEPVFAA
jgi:hypothetical protein